MESFLSVGISNALAAVVLALLAFAVDRIFRRPALSHCFWLLVLLKLVTPPLVHVPLPWPAEPRGDGRRSYGRGSGASRGNVGDDFSSLISRRFVRSSDLLLETADEPPTR